MEKLTDLQYSVLMQSIAIAKNMIDEGEFIDPYNNEEGVTDEDCKKAILEAEDLIMRNHLK